ncbi:MAG: cold shock domain-containing protein [Methyloprofundus sp.]|nr:cold shock domain-containing protein [Methyloprofundus sp.]
MSDTVFTGKLRQWNKDKDFGLIGQKKGQPDIFIHGLELKDLSRKPRVGDTISYQTITLKSGHVQAINGYIKGVSASQPIVKTQYQSALKLVTFIAIFVSIVAIVNLIKYLI